MQIYVADSGTKKKTMSVMVFFLVVYELLSRVEVKAQFHTHIQVPHLGGICIGH